MSFGLDIDQSSDRSTGTRKKPIATLADASPGDFVRLEFGHVLVKVYEQSKDKLHTWVRWVNEADGTESEPEVLSARWRGVREERAV